MTDELGSERSKAICSLFVILKLNWLQISSLKYHAQHPVRIFLAKKPICLHARLARHDKKSPNAIPFENYCPPFQQAASRKKFRLDSNLS